MSVAILAQGPLWPQWRALRSPLPRGLAQEVISLSDSPRPKRIACWFTPVLGDNTLDLLRPASRRALLLWQVACRA